MRVLISDETGLLKSIELEKNKQTVDSQRIVVLARADGIVKSYEASHSNNLSNTRKLVWSWPAPEKT
ncbi:hypothetical protein Plhal304r1_c012g0047971 [Plasmopara halstedii]